MKESNAERSCPFIGRRDFIKGVSLGALGAGLTVSSMGGAFAEEKGEKPKMHYRRLGRTDLKVSEIGFGGSIESPAVLSAAIDRGVNYIDTARGYGRSEGLIGEVMRRRRDEVILATKWDPQSEKTRKDILVSLETSLRELKTDYVDLIQVHGVGGARAVDPIQNTEMFEAFRIAKRDGKARFLGCTSHAGDRTQILSYAIKSGKFDVILVTLNYLTYEDAGTDKLLALAKQHDVGVVAMKVQQGGAEVKGVTDGSVSVRQANLKWALTKDVATAISSMSTFDLMKEDVAASGKRMSMKDWDVLERYAAAIAHDYCRMCDRCLPCPEGVAISTVLRYAMYYKHYHQPDRAAELYHKLTAHECAGACTGCGLCEERCTFGLPIMEKLREAERLMGQVV